MHGDGELNGHGQFIQVRRFVFPRACGIEGGLGQHRVAGYHAHFRDSAICIENRIDQYITLNLCLESE